MAVRATAAEGAVADVLVLLRRQLLLQLLRLLLLILLQLQLLLRLRRSVILALILQIYFSWDAALAEHHSFLC